MVFVKKTIAFLMIVNQRDERFNLDTFLSMGLSRIYLGVIAIVFSEMIPHVVYRNQISFFFLCLSNQSILFTW
jgi:hypothetical protein